MTIVSGNVPNHLIVGARTEFLSAVSQGNSIWKRVAGVINMTAKSQTLVDLGMPPMPIEDTGGSISQGFVEKTIAMNARNFYTKVSISRNAVEDDQTGMLEPKFRAAGERFNLHMEKLVIGALNGGDTSTYGLCYDGKTFFADDHADKGAAYTTAQDNKLATVLSLDNFTAAMAAAELFRDDQGEFSQHVYDLLIVPPALRYTAAQITQNATAYDTGNREFNPFSGVINHVVTPHFDSTAWIIAATGSVQKPLYIGMYETPNLMSAWFDPDAPEGGMYNFKFYARYGIVYGDWRLAIMGNS